MRQTTTVIYEPAEKVPEKKRVNFAMVAEIVSLCMLCGFGYSVIFADVSPQERAIYRVGFWLAVLIFAGRRR